MDMKLNILYEEACGFWKENDGKPIFVDKKGIMYP